MEPRAAHTPATVDKFTLRPVVRRALERDTAQVLDWQFDSLYGASGNSEIFRFSGNAQDGGTNLPWSLILKTIRSTDEEDDPISLRYWKREALALINMGMSPAMLENLMAYSLRTHPRSHIRG